MAQDRVGYAAFAQWEVELAQGKAKGLIGKYGFTPSDQADLEQELLLQIHLKRNVRRFWTEIEASERTVMSRILDNWIRDLIDRILSEKRKGHLSEETLHKEIPGISDGDIIRYEDFLREEDALWRPARPADAIEIHLAVEAAMNSGSDFQRQVLALLLKGYSVQGIARELHVQRTTVRRAIARIRNSLIESGLEI